MKQLFVMFAMACALCVGLAPVSAQTMPQALAQLDAAVAGVKAAAATAIPAPQPAGGLDALKRLRPPEAKTMRRGSGMQIASSFALFAGTTISLPFAKCGTVTTVTPGRMYNYSTTGCAGQTDIVFIPRGDGDVDAYSIFISQF